MNTQQFTVTKNKKLDTNELRHSGEVVAFFEFDNDLLYLKVISPSDEDWCIAALKQLYPHKSFSCVAYLSLDAKRYTLQFIK